ncbi:uncharacterized protein LOC134783878 [Penaeus indicus]|uniref:uncharacterized protein LOC134783878 n=1 Tax=Penaeus indicus TaxID=29960 RepID=UPI00300D51E9
MSTNGRPELVQTSSELGKKCLVRLVAKFGKIEKRGSSMKKYKRKQTMEKHHKKQKVLHMAFIDLEKAYDRVPRQEVWRGLRERGVQEKYARIAQECYKDVTTKVRNTVDPPWCILYADDIVLVAESRRTLERKLEEWRVALESRGIRISRSKTEYFTTDMSGNQQATIKLNGTDLKRVKPFKYLGSVVDETVGMEREVNFRIRCGWNNWRKISGIIRDKRVPVRLKGKVHKAVVRPALI